MEWGGALHIIMWIDIREGVEDLFGTESCLVILGAFVTGG
jgi:hypothetical protein